MDICYVYSAINKGMRSVADDEELTLGDCFQNNVTDNPEQKSLLAKVMGKIDTYDFGGIEGTVLGEVISMAKDTASRDAPSYASEGDIERLEILFRLLGIATDGLVPVPVPANDEEAFIPPTPKQREAFTQAMVDIFAWLPRPYQHKVIAKLREMERDALAEKVLRTYQQTVVSDVNPNLC